MSKQKIQIAVAIDSKGHWLEHGFGHEVVGGWGQDAAIRGACDVLAGQEPVEVHIIEAELPIPEPKTVRGTVRKA